MVDWSTVRNGGWPLRRKVFKAYHNGILPEWSPPAGIICVAGGRSGIGRAKRVGVRGKGVERGGGVGGGRSAFRTAHDAYRPAQVFRQTFDLQTVPPTQSILQERG